jgi:hypothetical protein
MAELFSSSKLNNVAGSMGESNIWIYTGRHHTLAAMSAANYWVNADRYGVRNHDAFLLVGSDGLGLGIIDNLTATTSTMTTVSSF